MNIDKIRFLDVETTGLPTKKSKWREDFMEFPHLVSISWIFNNIESDYIIQPKGYEIPEEATAIHGITTEVAMKKGFDLSIPLQSLVYDAINADLVVGHGLYFDTSIIQANVLRSGSDMLMSEMAVALSPSRRLCTMMKTIKFCGLKQDGKNTPKFPSLQELHMRCFGREFEGAHSSLADVRATKACYVFLMKEGVIS